MKKAEVNVGQKYAAKVSDKVVPVRIDAENARGGWDATNVATGKGVRIKSAQRLRGPWEPDGDDATTPNEGAPVAKKAAESTKDAKAKMRGPRAKTGASGLDAAAKVLAEAGEPLTCKEIVRRAFDMGYWASDGKTPHATVYSAILREIQHKGTSGRFCKVARGMFGLQA